MTLAPGSILSLCYARIAVQEPIVSADFAERILGLRKSGSADGISYLRAGILHHAIAYLPAEASEVSVGIELADAEALEQAAASLSTAGFSVRPAKDDACRARQVQAAILARDATGNAIDLVIRPRHAAERFFGARDAGVKDFQGLALRSTDLVGDTRFWRLLGARESDWVGPITYLRFDSLHHRISLYPAERPGILYLELTVGSLDHLMQSHYFLQEHQVRILHGPGRETASGQAFLRFHGPDDVIYAYVHGIAEIDPACHRPRQFPHDDASLCGWGSVCSDIPELIPPDRWPEAERTTR
jgi:2,3-dihydroxy-p-cumate/2,3-dihydroxybenzoate 3,4-dioxygenase